MTTVTFCTHCHPRDLPRLHAPGNLEKMIASHQYDFNEIIVVHQRCEGLEYSFNIKNGRVVDITEQDYPILLAQFGMNYNDTRLDEITHGWTWQWYWQHHCVNHLKEILEATSDYIVFSDADCRIQSQSSSWIEKGIELLEETGNIFHPRIFMVSPSEGGHDYEFVLPNGTRCLQMTSQQLFMARTKDMKSLDFTNLQWDGQFIVGGPMQEFYGLFEGWLYRYLVANRLYRAILPEQWRYWHLGWH